VRKGDKPRAGVLGGVEDDVEGVYQEVGAELAPLRLHCQHFVLT
jgi:hypothetical protein